MVEASLPPSPTFSLQRISGQVEVEIERRIVANILALAMHQLGPALSR